MDEAGRDGLGEVMVAKSRIDRSDLATGGKRGDGATVYVPRPRCDRSQGDSRVSPADLR